MGEARMFGLGNRAMASASGAGLFGGTSRSALSVRSTTVIAVALSAVVLLCGCAASAGTGAGGVAQATLAETKSAAQLLRNEAASRLPDIIVKEVNETTDLSESCKPVADDPDGLERSWLSTTSILLTNSQSARIEVVSEELAQSFVDQGWVESKEASSNQTLIALTNESSLARIEFSVEPKAKGQQPAIRISTTGPCVTTAGGESDEVKKLEGRE